MFKRRSGGIELEVKVSRTVLDNPSVAVRLDSSNQIDDWIRSQDVALRTRNALLATISILFNFAKKRSCLPSSEDTGKAGLKNRIPDSTEAVGVRCMASSPPGRSRAEAVPT
ncbi:MAG: hypothetical protein CMO74_00030 [Verrucomicrobiales bacterium]|nr:hypothetical protein [Verrucomicrobiales bacterium]